MLILKVRLEFDSRPVDADELDVPKAWGDATDLKGVTNARNAYSEGRAWDLVKNWVVPSPPADHHAIVEPDYFEFNTQNGLIHSRLNKLAPVLIGADCPRAGRWRRALESRTVCKPFGAGGER
jgi:hypothetical protein